MRVHYLRFFLISAVLLFTSLKSTSQNLQVFDVNTSAYPTISAKWLAYDNNYTRITNLTTSDFTVTEDGQNRSVTLVTCPTQTPVPISSVLVVDISGSMSWAPFYNINLARAAASAWVRAINLTTSECALTSFNHYSYFDQDFTQNRQRLLDKIAAFSPFGGTNYDEALYTPPAGGTQVIKNGRFKKVIVFLTDGMPNFPPDETTIINAAKQYNAKIYCITLNLPAHSSMKNFASQTGGLWWENVKTEQEARDIYLKILNIEQGLDPCDIRWTSGPGCSAKRTAAVAVPARSLTANVSYTAPATSVSKLEIVPDAARLGIVRPGTTKDTTFRLTARNGAVTVNNITSNNNLFTLPGLSVPFTLQKDESRTVTVRFSPADSGYTTGQFTVQKSQCGDDVFFASAGDPAKKSGNNTLRIVHPNGGEKFLICDDTLITWDGCMPSDTVSILVSLDNGTNWLRITDSAKGLKQRVMFLDTNKYDQCLAKVVLSKFTGINAGWVKNPYVPSDTNYGFSIAVDASGNIYFAGSFSGIANFDDNIDLTSSGGKDIFIAKFNSSYVCQWAKKAGGRNNDAANGLTVDEFGNLYITGYFSDSAYFGNSIYLISGGKKDIFVAKFNSGGLCQWAEKAGSADTTKNDEGKSIILDNNGNIYISGYFEANPGFGNGKALGSNGGRDIFVAKYNSSHLCQWVSGAGGTSDDEGAGITLDNSNNVYISGWFGGTANFGNGKSAASAGSSDIFAAKYDNSGVCQMVWRGGGTSADEGHNIALDEMGNIFVTGSFQGTANFGNGVTASSRGGKDAFTVKVNKSGSCVWANTGGGAGADEGYGLAVDYIGNVFTTGYFNSTAVFCSTMQIDASGEEDSYMIKTDNDGACEWLYWYGNESQNKDFAVTADNKGNVFSTGISNYDTYIFKVDYGQVLQQDVSDATWSILTPNIQFKSLDYGQVVVNTVRDTILAAFVTNSTQIPVTIDSIKIQGNNASEFRLISGIPPYTLSNNEIKNLEVSFRPTSTGNKSAILRIYAGCVIYERSLSGSAVTPRLQTIAKCVDFGKVPVGKQKDSTDNIIKNISGSTLTISGSNILGPDITQFSIVTGGGGFSLSNNESRQMSLRFAPSEKGRTSTRLGFFYNGPGSPVEVCLTGEGVVTPLISTISSMQFGTLVCEVQPKDSMFAVKNTGNDTLKITNATISGANSVDFELTAPFTQRNIPPDSTVVIGIRFSPKTAGNKSATLELTSNAGNAQAGKTNITLNGLKNKVEFILSTNSVAFNNLDENTPATTTIEITNKGTLPISWNAPIALGKFTIESIQPQTTAPNNGKSTVNIRFAGAPQGSSYDTSYIFTDTCRGIKKLDLSARVKTLNPQITHASTLVFQNMLCETIQTLSIEVKNTGGAELVITKAEITGANAVDFSLAVPFSELRLAPTESRNIQVKFTPSLSGNKTANLVFSSNAFNATNGKTTVVMNGRKDLFKIKFDPDIVDFGTLQPDETKDNNVTITNEGTVPVYWTYPLPLQIFEFTLKSIIPSVTSANGGTSLATVSFDGSKEEKSFERNFEYTDTCQNKYLLTLKAKVVIVKDVSEGVDYDDYLDEPVPNPSLDFLSINYRISGLARTELAVYDVFGRKHITLENTYSEKGNHNAVIDVSSLPAGTYFIIFRIRENSFIKKVEVIH